MKPYAIIIPAMIMLALAAAEAKEFDFQRYFSKKWHVNANDVIVIENPIGEIQIANTEPELGSFVVVKQRIFASFDELAKSRQMVMMVRVNDTRRPDSLILETQFPMHMFDKYCYPEMGGLFTSEIEGTWQGQKMTISPRKGEKLWSDVHVEIPAGHRVIIRSLAASFLVEDFHGDIDFATNHASAMTAGDIVGNLFITTCHGGLSVSKFTGELFYDGEDSDISFCDVVKGKVNAKSTTGDIIWSAKCDSLMLLEIESLSGKIMFNGEFGKFTRLTNDEGNIRIEPTSHIIDSLVATTVAGNIELTMPENYAGELLASADAGKIKHRLPNGDAKNIRTALKGQGGKIVLKSARGAIDISLKATK